MISRPRLAAGILAALVPALAWAKAPDVEGTGATTTQPTTQPAEDDEEHVPTDIGEFERPAPVTKPAATGPTTQPADEEEEHVPTETGEFEREPEEPPPVEEPKEKLLKVTDDLWLGWRNGPILLAPEKKSQIRFGGSLMADVGWVDGHGLSGTGIDLTDDAEWRRLRLYASGLVRNRLEFKLRADFAGSGTTLIDAWVRWRDLPYAGDVTVGRQKVPFSLEHLTSGLYTTFLERALPNALVPRRPWGVMANKRTLDERMTWAAGVFRSTDDACTGFADNGNAFSLAGRVTCLPWYEDKGGKLVHLGASYSISWPNDAIRYRKRPEASFLDVFTDTGPLDSDRIHLLGCEAALVHGPFSLQGEYHASVVQSSSPGDMCFNGFYVQGSYFLTGERRRYNTHTGVFGQILPKKSFLTERGWGAWELAARYSYLGLDKAGLPDSARDMQDVTLGLNWYLSQHVRISWNYIRSWLDGPDTAGEADLFVMRFQVAF